MYFFLSISLGSLLFVLFHHLTRAGWSVVLRRIFEGLMKNNILMIILFCPMIFFLPELFAWMTKDGNLVNATNITSDWHKHLEHSLHAKHFYLNKQFFFIRAIIYFSFWGIISWYFFRKSVNQDYSGDIRITEKLGRKSTWVAMIVGLTLTFAAFDWIMSLDYAWFSTIFGVIYFATCCITSLSSLIIIVWTLKKLGFLGDIINTEHLHDVGKLLFGFMLFFMYVAFSQFLLIAYADISIETVWFNNRYLYGWKPIVWLLFWGHFLLPFALFLSRHIKRHKIFILVMGIWMLVISYIHLYWQILPNATYPTPYHLDISFVDFIIPVALGTIYVAGFIYNLKNSYLVPIKDPRLKESLKFHNF